MAIRFVRLGRPRLPGEGLRIGTVRRPPRGVPRARWAADDWYDVWLPNLAPSPAVMKLGQAAGTEAQWVAFARRYRAEMARPETARVIDLLAVLSHSTDFSVGCYCENGAHCHSSVLRSLLEARGARLHRVASPGSAAGRATRRPKSP